MDAQRFDRIARALAAPTTRRRVLGGISVAVASALVPRGRIEAACPPDQVERRGRGCVCKTTGRPPDVGGFCPCAQGLTRCRVPSGWACVDVGGDEAHCGGCGIACLPGPNAEATCRRGLCLGVSCLPGYTDCDGDPTNGCETQLGTIENCSTCGEVCPEVGNGVAFCDTFDPSDPFCGWACNDGFKRCDGVSSCVPESACCAADECRAADPGNCEASVDCVSGECVYLPADAAAVCRPGVCTDGMATPATHCTGSTVGCPPAAGPVACNPYVCDAQGQACLAICATDDDCIAASHCEVGVCAPDLAAGAACDEPSDCASDVCCGAVCCAVGETCNGSNRCERQFAVAGTATWTVPAGVARVRFDVYGAEGGGSAQANGGQGGRASGALPVSGGETFTIVVGQRGGFGHLPGSGTGGAPNGGDGGTGRSNNGGGGGGSSEVQRDGARLIVGGGGGGARVVNPGGHGGGTSGSDGATGLGGAGTGATSSGPGAGGVFLDSNSAPGQNGAADGQGGAGGSANSFAGGGGGGGFFGGGGGGSSTSGGGGGGGGGGGNGFVDGNATDPVLETGGRLGDGLVIVTYPV